jgi:hypothetical protein
MGGCCSTVYGDEAFGKSKELPAEKRDTTQDSQNNNTLRRYKETRDQRARTREFEDMDYRDKSNN